MSRMNWLIELKILYEEIHQKTSSVLISDLTSLIQSHIPDFILIDEETYYSTHSEIGLTPFEIISALQTHNKPFVLYDDLFNLFSKMNKTKNDVNNTNINDNYYPNNNNNNNTRNNNNTNNNNITNKNNNNNNTNNHNNNVRSSTEHIIETARFNKPEDEKNEEKMNSPFKEIRDHSPLSFSMSAIKMTETPGSKTFTLSEYGYDMFRCNENKKEFSGGKGQCLLLNQYPQEQETVIQRKVKRKRDGFIYHLERLEKISPNIIKQIKNYVCFESFNQEKKYGFSIKGENLKDFYQENDSLDKIFLETFVF